MKPPNFNTAVESIVARGNELELSPWVTMRLVVEFVPEVAGGLCLVIDRRKNNEPRAAVANFDIRQLK